MIINTGLFYSRSEVNGSYSPDSISFLKTRSEVKVTVNQNMLPSVSLGRTICWRYHLKKKYTDNRCTRDKDQSADIRLSHNSLIKFSFG